MHAASHPTYPTQPPPLTPTQTTLPSPQHQNRKQHLEYILATLAKAVKPHKGLVAFTLEALKDGDPQLLRERERAQGQQAAGEQEEEWILRDTGACVCFCFGGDGWPVVFLMRVALALPDALPEHTFLTGPLNQIQR